MGADGTAASGAASRDRASSAEPRTYELEGARCTSLEAFFAELDRCLGLAFWSHELDALGEVVRGALGAEEGGCVLVWRDAREARASLGYPATAAYLEARLRACPPGDASALEEELGAVRRREGTTLFERVLEVFEAQRAAGVEIQLVW